MTQDAESQTAALNEELAKTAIGALIRRLADPVEEVAEAALEALQAFDGVALNSIVQAAKDADTDRAQRALRWLAAAPVSLEGTVAIETARAALRAAPAPVRAEAARCCSKLLQRRAAAVATDLAAWVGLPAELCAAARDDDPVVREAAAAALGNLPQVDRESLASLQEALNDNSSRAVRESAARSLGKLARLLQVAPQE